jgi:hypothetical protein
MRKQIISTRLSEIAKTYAASRLVTSSHKFSRVLPSLPSHCMRYEREISSYYLFASLDYRAFIRRSTARLIIPIIIADLLHYWRRVISRVALRRVSHWCRAPSDIYLDRGSLRRDIGRLLIIYSDKSWKKVTSPWSNSIAVQNGIFFQIRVSWKIKRYFFTSDFRHYNMFVIRKD